MEALILAAGLGTRLRPLTNEIPKALVEVDGVPMLERVARQLVGAGATRLVINTHHFADRVEEFVRSRDGFGAEVRFSREEGAAPLETGGGIQQAARYLGLDAPFLVHNADVITGMPLRELYEAHRSDALATLAVSNAQTRSPLLVDDRGVLGVRYPSGSEERARDAAGEVRDVAFAGVSVVSHELPGLMTESGRFSVIPVYLRLIAAGRRVDTWDIGASLWLDIGTHERLEEANRLLAGREQG